MEKSTLIIITGPESSGKSTLMKSLCATTGAKGIDEYARTYLQKIDRDYHTDDLLHIADKQMNEIHAAVVEIWYEEKFGPAPEALKAMTKTLPTRHYLLCKPDLPWVEDPLRENPHDRDRLFNIYLDWLNIGGHSFSVVSGTKRLEASLEIVKKIQSLQQNS
jgi:nicotinamide riboside kinase